MWASRSTALISLTWLATDYLDRVRSSFLDISGRVAHDLRGEFTQHDMNAERGRFASFGQFNGPQITLQVFWAGISD